jgi:hypothetical protein
LAAAGCSQLLDYVIAPNASPHDGILGVSMAEDEGPEWARGLVGYEAMLVALQRALNPKMQAISMLEAAE